MKKGFSLAVLKFLLYRVLATNQTVPGISDRIIDGHDGFIENHPFLVRLRSPVGWCGANIISAWHALTAAHCLFPQPHPDTVTLYGGSTSQTNGGVIFYVNDIVLHPDYNPSILDNDIAVITVKNTFENHLNIDAIALQFTEIELPSILPTWCYVVGWGATNGVTNEAPDNLMFVWLPLVSSDECGRQWTTLTDNMICAQSYASSDICHGDSGGPLVCSGLLTGIVSGTTEKCTSNKPAVFTKIMSANIRPFIRDITGI